MNRSKDKNSKKTRVKDENGKKIKYSKIDLSIPS